MLALVHRRSTLCQKYRNRWKFKYKYRYRYKYRYKYRCKYRYKCTYECRLVWNSWQWNLHIWEVDKISKMQIKLSELWQKYLRCGQNIWDANRNIWEVKKISERWQKYLEGVISAVQKDECWHRSVKCWVENIPNEVLLLQMSGNSRVGTKIQMQIKRYKCRSGGQLNIAKIQIQIRIYKYRTGQEVNQKYPSGTKLS